MAVAAKEQESAGMDKAELKKTLILAKRMPMHVALALDGAGAAIVVLDKIKKGETIVRELKSKAKDSKSHRFGMCVIDEENPKRAIFTVNKAAGGGMARKLIKALKGTGFSKVIVKLEDGTIDEPEEDEDEEEEGGGDGLGMRSPEVLNGASSGAAAPRAGGDTLGPNDAFPAAEAPEGTMADMSAAQPAPADDAMAQFAQPDMQTMPDMGADGTQQAPSAGGADPNA